MPERCDHPRGIARSGGRAICSDELKNWFKDKEKCFNCPKVTGISLGQLGLARVRTNMDYERLVDQVASEIESSASFD